MIRAPRRVTDSLGSPFSAPVISDAIVSTSWFLAEKQYTAPDTPTV